MAWDDFQIKMRNHICHSPPYAKGYDGDVALGGLWFDPLYQIIVKSMPDVPDRDQVKV